MPSEQKTTEGATGVTCTHPTFGSLNVSFGGMRDMKVGDQITISGNPNGMFVEPPPVETNGYDEPVAYGPPWNSFTVTDVK